MPLRVTLDGYTPPLLVLAAAVLLIALRGLAGQLQRRWAAVWVDVMIMIAMVSVAGGLELAMGRTPTYRYGPVRVWSGNVQSNQNSQQLADPYSFTHVIHGAAFYGLTRVALGTRSLGLRAIVAVTLEATWEVLENTDMVINRYRTTTIALEYDGDSVLNSLGDILACVLGFVLAWRLPLRVTILGIVGVEVLLAYWIRDNLTLNILMLLTPLQAIKTWQRGL